MIIITRQRELSKSRQVKKDLNSILNKWKWGTTAPKTSQEFLAKFTPWVNEKIQLGNEVKELLERKGVDNLADIA
jgi:uncharacterized protein with von Willebrand factor type A (vWA) domain